MRPVRPSFHPSSAAVRALVLWLIALALPFDGAAVGADAVRGSLHVHRPPAAAALRLVDFRRASVPGASPWQANHRHAGAQRHRHAFADASVVVIGDDEADASHGAATVLASLVALPTTACDWQAATLPGSGAWCAPWTPSTGRRERLERPPRAA